MLFRSVTVIGKKGAVKVYRVKLKKGGNGYRQVPFSSKKVKAVEVTVANASGRYTCDANRRVTYSCNGVSKDDNRVQKFRARVKK